jgi:hypothetical protein
VDRKTFRRRKQVRHAILGVIAVVGLVWGYTVIHDPQPAPPTTAQEPPTSSASPTEEPDPEVTELERAVRQFSRFYESPPSPQRTLMLRSMCLAPTRCEIPGLDDVDTSEAAKGAQKIKITVAKDQPHEFELEELGFNMVRVESTTYLLVKQPGQPNHIDASQLVTQWINDDNYGWRFVVFLPE